jgi:hypothetical protein
VAADDERRELTAEEAAGPEPELEPEPEPEPELEPEPEPEAGAEPELELESRPEPGGEPPEEEMDGLAIMPGFQAGGRVERTGIALVHEGEYIVPAPGSVAVVSPEGAGPAQQEVTWTFPVEVEVVGELSEEHLQAVARHVFDELDTAFRGVG